MEKVLYEYGFNLENLLLCLIPLAVGLEYGVNTMWNAGGLSTQTDMDNNVVEFNSDASTWELGHQARLTLTYFFKL